MQAIFTASTYQIHSPSGSTVSSTKSGFQERVHAI